jgi:branched-chain amino acid transport system substrate-binding protein
MHGIQSIPSRTIGLTLVAAAVFGVYGCSKEEPKQAAAPKTTAAAPAATPAAPAEETITVKIGHAGPLTGGIAHLGKDDENGVHLAVDEATAKKIKLGGKVVKFEMMSEDDQADPKLGPTIAQKFVDAKVAGVVGHLNSGVSIPASAVYNQAGLPMISGSATNPKLTEQGFKTIFRTVARDDQQGPAIAAYIANELKLKKVAIADDATAYGEGLANEVEKTLKAAGVQIVTREKTNDKATDFKAILTKIKGRNPDAVFYGGMDATGGPMLKQARELGIKATFAYGDGACTSEMNKLAGDKAAEGMICSQAGIPTQMSSKTFVDAFNAKFGEIKQYAPYFYDSTNVLIAAMQKADSADPAKYLPELHNTSYDGATGHIEFDEKGDRKDAEITIFQMKGGKVDPVAIIKAGKSTKIGGDTQAAAPAAPAAPAMAPAMAPAPKK